MALEDREQLFDSWAKRYDPAGSESPFPFGGYERVLEAIVASSNVESGQSVLDVGIGTGNLAEHFVRAGCEVWGTDFSQKMLTRAEERLPEVHTVKADLRSNAMDLGRRFDRVVSAYVLHEFPLPEKLRILKELVEHSLTPDGWLVIGDIAFPTSEIQTAAAEQAGDRWDADEFYWVADEALLALENVGLSGAYTQISSCAGLFVIGRDSDGGRTASPR